MKRVLLAILVVSLATCLSYAAAIPSNSIYGNYVEARTADVYTGPCFANSEVGLTGQLAVFGWKVTKGSWDGVALDDLGVESFATSVWLDIHDSVMTDLGFPRETASDGTTWIRTDL